jgi:hypothetical protein
VRSAGAEVRVPRLPLHRARRRSSLRFSLHHLQAAGCGRPGPYGHRAIEEHRPDPVRVPLLPGAGHAEQHGDAPALRVFLQHGALHAAGLPRQVSRREPSIPRPPSDDSKVAVCMGAYRLRDCMRRDPPSSAGTPGRTAPSTRGSASRPPAVSP